MWILNQFLRVSWILFATALSYIGHLKNKQIRMAGPHHYRCCLKNYKGKIHILQVSCKPLKKRFSCIQKNTCAGTEQLRSFILLGYKSVSSCQLLALFSSISPLFSFLLFSDSLIILVFHNSHLILVLFNFLLPICPSPNTLLSHLLPCWIVTSKSCSFFLNLD